MAERLHPGVYVEEVSSGVRPIEGVSTSTAAFIGETARGVPNMPHFLTSFADFTRLLGGYAEGDKGLMAHAVEAFFKNGGARAYAVRVLPDDADPGESLPVSTRKKAEGSAGNLFPPALSFVAKGDGAWADALGIEIADATHFPGEAFQIKVTWTEGGSTKVLETFDDVRMDWSNSEDYVADVIERGSRYITANDMFRVATGQDGSQATAWPIPEEAPVIKTGYANASGKYQVYANSKLLFQSWTGENPSGPPTEVLFSQDDEVAIADLVTTLSTGLGSGFAVAQASANGKSWIEIRPAVNVRGYLLIPNAMALNGHDVVIAWGSGTSDTNTGAVTVSVSGANVENVFAGVSGALTSAPITATRVGDSILLRANDNTGVATMVVFDRSDDSITFGATPIHGKSGPGGAFLVIPSAQALKPDTVKISWVYNGSADFVNVDCGAAGVVSDDNVRAAIALALSGKANAPQVKLGVAGAGITGAPILIHGGSLVTSITIENSSDSNETYESVLAQIQRGGAALPAQTTFDNAHLSVAEVRPPGMPSTLRSLGLGGGALARGYRESSPANPLARPAKTASNTRISLPGGSDGEGAVGIADFTGLQADRTGIYAFDPVDINLLAIPGKTDISFISLGMTYCDGRGDCFFLADGPGIAHGELDITTQEAKNATLSPRSKNAAMYYPWVQITDPLGIGKNPTIYAPPSGFMAGIYARTDENRGVWKAPAGIEATVSGALGLQVDLVDADQDELNPASLNCLRQFPSTGVVSWGARTLSNDAEWRYVSVRRMAIFLKESLRRGMKWAVFEPNDEQLWDQIRSNIKAFMLGLFRQGAFQGSTPDEAFRVKCDRSTNPQENVDAGIVTAQVAFAPLKPAEFVVIEISQKSLVS